MNKYFFTLLCITVLAVAPACKRKRARKPIAQKTVKTVETTVLAANRNNDAQSINKF